jgi:hypothetical protein
MLVASVIALIAALVFRKTARGKGYCAARIWLSPIAVAGLLSLVVVLLGLWAGKLLGPSGSPLLAIYPDLLGFLAIMLQLAWITKAWGQIKALPVRQTKEGSREHGQG